MLDNVKKTNLRVIRINEKLKGSTISITNLFTEIMGGTPPVKGKK